MLDAAGPTETATDGPPPARARSPAAPLAAAGAVAVAADARARALHTLARAARVVPAGTPLTGTTAAPVDAPSPPPLLGVGTGDEEVGPGALEEGGVCGAGTPPGRGRVPVEVTDNRRRSCAAGDATPRGPGAGDAPPAGAPVSLEPPPPPTVGALEDALPSCSVPPSPPT
jgi:hypothetical protein